MKKLILLLLAILAIGCSGDSNNGNNGHGEEPEPEPKIEYKDIYVASERYLSVDGESGLPHLGFFYKENLSEKNWKEIWHIGSFPEYKAGFEFHMKVRIEYEEWELDDEILVPTWFCDKIYSKTEKDSEGLPNGTVKE